jgi:hypothetical protein
VEISRINLFFLFSFKLSALGQQFYLQKGEEFSARLHERTLLEVNLSGSVSQKGCKSSYITNNLTVSINVKFFIAVS